MDFIVKWLGKSPRQRHVGITARTKGLGICFWLDSDKGHSTTIDVVLGWKELEQDYVPGWPQTVLEQQTQRLQ